MKIKCRNCLRFLKRPLVPKIKICLINCLDVVDVKILHMIWIIKCVPKDIFQTEFFGINTKHLRATNITHHTGTTNKMKWNEFSNKSIFWFLEHSTVNKRSTFISLVLISLIRPLDNNEDMQCSINSIKQTSYIECIVSFIVFVFFLISP